MSRSDVTDNVNLSEPAEEYLRKLAGNMSTTPEELLQVAVRSLDIGIQWERSYRETLTRSGSEQKPDLSLLEDDVVQALRLLLTIRKEGKISRLVVERPGGRRTAIELPEMTGDTKKHGSISDSKQ